MWSGAVGGAERAVFQLVSEQLRGKPIEPSVLYAGGSGPYFDRLQRIGCPVTALNLPRAWSPRHFTSARRIMRQFDIHHFHSAEPLLMAASISCPGITRVYTQRGGLMTYPFRPRVRYGVVGFLVKHFFHALSANTAHGARSAAKLFDMDAEKFRVTYNGIDFSLLEPERPSDEIRRELRLRPGEFVIGTAAILKPWKRIERLIHALAALSDIEARLVILGDGSERLALEVLARDLKVRHRVVFWGLQRDVKNYLQVFDAFCLPSGEMESFGNAAVEAMAVGVPTIVFSDGGGLVEHIDPGKSGFVVADQTELEEVLRRLSTDAGLSTAIGRGGHDEIRRRYTVEKAAARYEELYKSARLGKLELEITN